MTVPQGVASRPNALRTELCELLGVEYPIIQTGMGYVSGAELTAATSEAGGLGILAAATMSLAELETAINRIQERTTRPFGVNMRSDRPDVADQASIMIEREVRVASFALAPSPMLLDRFRSAGVVCIPSVGARRHAEKVASWGADAVIVQGSEAGGHTGPVPTSVLLPQVVDCVDIPVVAAGGFFDGRGLVAALAYGACGIAMGTRFLMTSDSTVPRETLAAYVEADVGDTTVTSLVDGHPHRMIQTPFIEKLERAGRLRSIALAIGNARAFKRLSGAHWRDMISEGRSLHTAQDYSLNQVVMAANAPMLCRVAMVDGRTDLGILSSGQVVGLLDDLPTCKELIARIMTEAASVLARLES